MENGSNFSVTHKPTVEFQIATLALSILASMEAYVKKALAAKDTHVFAHQATLERIVRLLANHAFLERVVKGNV